MDKVALRLPESSKSQFIMEGCEYWREGVDYSMFSSSLLECGAQFFPSPDYVNSKSYHSLNICEKGSCSITEEDFVTKKLSHNANERQRRKKMNALYAKLQSLLPHSNTRMKPKMSNPAIVRGVLKYISQLRSDIETLSRQRKKLLAHRLGSEQAVALKISPAHASAMLLNEEGFNESPDAIFPQVSIHRAGRMLLINVQTAHGAPVLFSRLLLLFEEEKLDVLSASTFVSDEKFWHSIQVKGMESWKFDTSDIHLKILNLFEQRRIHFVRQSSRCFQS